MAGNAFMDKLSRFVVVSSGGVVKQEKERIKKRVGTVLGLLFIS